MLTNGLIVPRNFKHYALVFAGLALFATLPFMVVHPSGSASAGLSAGFLGIMNNPFRLLLLLPVGIMAGYLQGDERVLFPLSFLLMYLIGSLMEMDFVLFPMVKLFILGAILVFGLALSVAESRLFLASVFLGGWVAYHIGGYGMQSLPALASPLYLIIGQLLALVLVVAVSFSIGLLIFNDTDKRNHSGKGAAKRLAA